MKQLLFISLILISNLTDAETKSVVKREPASEAENCQIVTSIYGVGAMTLEGFYIGNCGDSIKFVPANPLAMKLHSGKNGIISYSETQTAIGKFPASIRKIESQPNIIREGKTFSSLTIAKDKNVQKRYVFEHQNKTIVSMSYVNAESGEKFFIDGAFCHNELPALLEKMGKIANGCNDLVNEIEKKQAELQSRDNGSLEVAEAGLTIKNKALKSKNNFSSFQKLTQLNQMCSQYGTIVVPLMGRVFGGQLGPNTGASTFGL